MPLPIGRPWARKEAYWIWSVRRARETRLALHCPCGLGGGRQRGHLATEFLEHRLGAARAEFLQLSLAPISLLGAIVEQVDQPRG
jgi:hypothetical protein